MSGICITIPHDCRAQIQQDYDGIRVYLHGEVTQEFAKSLLHVSLGLMQENARRAREASTPPGEAATE